MRCVADIPLRIVLVGKDIELRVVSLIVRAREIADDVVFLDLGSNDTTVELTEEVGCQTLHFNSVFDAVHLAKFLKASPLDAASTTLAIHITDGWKLQDISLSINRARELWDLHISHQAEPTGDEQEAPLVLSELEIRHVVMTEAGMDAMASISIEGTSDELEEGRNNLGLISNFLDLLYIIAHEHCLIKHIEGVHNPH